MPEPRQQEFSWIEGLSICLAMIGVQLSSEVMNQWAYGKEIQPMHRSL